MNTKIKITRPNCFKRFKAVILVVGVFFGGFQVVFGQTGSVYEPVRYVGGIHIDRFTHEGGLRYAIGVENIQTMRANRTHPEWSDGFGWTYNHASNLAYWNGQFFQQYLSGESDEHVPPVQTLLITSKNGKEWSFPQVIFPPYQAPEGVALQEGATGYMMHQRMGFYVAPNGRFLTLAFYGHSENPFRENGIGRVVREIYKDGSFGPIYFIRYDSQTKWNETNTSYPFYKTSKDKGFIKACEALLSNKLQTLQWFEEDNGDDGFYSFNKGEQAFSWYHRKDGKVVGLWKKSYVALSDDEGETFSNPVKAKTLIMSGGKVWGQQTDDGKYAMSYNPIDQTQYRFPMALATSDDGIVYDNLLLVQGEVPPRRFFGRWKDFGPCYMRGITEGNGNPPGDDMWMTYSMNKEDIWMSRIPVPVKYVVEEDIHDDFENMKEGGHIIDWNTYSPKWAQVSLVKENSGNQCLLLIDEDYYDYSRAIRVFKEGTQVSASFKLKLESVDTTQFDIDITDRYGNRPVQISIDKNGVLNASKGSNMKSILKLDLRKWYNIKIVMNTAGLGSYSLFVNEEQILTEASTVMAVKSVERISFRTGAYRDIPNRETPNEVKYPPLENADEKQNKSMYLIDDVFISSELE
ncbi:exo-alpha-sialidase [Aestuariibaculum lutulentum]|uniref:Exo-alpha-sialidase n=1 Tax=Aestuariibaculum lutulentum TaxID=2920935 RepID=A0ABS9RLN7_9FLAO|nr:exo-alpha-sialidase [Aestuariibaculum lutulentum]MCH4553868.1 exo-alpha-sialidase [Aestuariibaculum lutulentum]